MTQFFPLTFLLSLFILFQNVQVLVYVELNRETFVKIGDGPAAAVRGRKLHQATGQEIGKGVAGRKIRESEDLPVQMRGW